MRRRAETEARNARFAPAIEGGAKLLAARRRIDELETALRRALTIIDSPAYRDTAGMRPSAHPAVDDIRAVLNNSAT